MPQCHNVKSKTRMSPQINLAILVTEIQYLELRGVIKCLIKTLKAFNSCQFSLSNNCDRVFLTTCC